MEKFLAELREFRKEQRQREAAKGYVSNNPSVLDVLIPVEPEAKLRARMGRFGAYTPAKTVANERAIRAYVRMNLPNNFEPFKRGVPLQVIVTFYRKRAKSVKSFYPVVKPDLDNIIKTLDSLNEIVWHDDSQIVSIVAQKRYSTQSQGFIHLKVSEFREAVAE